ncbi:unnamed protein product, partial [Adineta ricciae]
AFTTTICYEPDVDLHSLREHFGTDYVDKLFFHILAFEANKILSLGPKTLDPGPHARWFTPAFTKLWQTIGHKVWAQWRYQHNLPDYKGPLFDTLNEPTSLIPAVKIEPGDVEVLAFCGGGKDSLIAMTLLQSAKIPFSTLVYSHSIYGALEAQHCLIDRLIDTCTPITRHKQWIKDTFLDTPVSNFYTDYEIEHVLAAETPASVFGSLPLILSRGFRYIIVAHERSADIGNLIWDITGEDVNHQWGKSLEAEKMINDYIHNELILGFTYFSILKPLYDVLIFSILKNSIGSIPFTHSCNVKKPWCKRCAKCAYIWLNYMAYLPFDLVDGIFEKENLLNLPENQLYYRQMLGLEKHTPFECIGQVLEVQLAFELAHRKGLQGVAMDIYLSEVSSDQNWLDIITKYTRVASEDTTNMPHSIKMRILPLMDRDSIAARKQLATILDLPNI